MYITVNMLRAHGACETSVEIFATEWPKGVEVTEESCFRAIELGLDIDWAARTYLSEPYLREYHNRVRPYVKDFNLALSRLEEFYDDAINPHKRAYLQAIEPFDKALDMGIAKERKYVEAILAKEFLIQASQQPPQRLKELHYSVLYTIRQVLRIQNK